MNDYIIRDQIHEMIAEGTSNSELKDNAILVELLKRGFNAFNIEIWFDEMMNVYRWKSDILPI